MCHLNRLPEIWLMARLHSIECCARACQRVGSLSRRRSVGPFVLQGLVGFCSRAESALCCFWRGKMQKGNDTPLRCLHRCARPTQSKQSTACLRRVSKTRPPTKHKRCSSEQI